MKTLLKVVLNMQEPTIHINQEWTDPKKAKYIPRTTYLPSFKKQRVIYHSEQISKDIILNPVNRAEGGGGKLKLR